MFPIKRILWPTDFSDASLLSLKTVKHLAKQYRAKVWAVHAVPPVSALGAELIVTMPQYEGEIIKSATDRLNKIVKQKIGEAFIVYPVIKVGAAAEVISQISKDEKIDIIVIATHGESGFHHFIFGSVAEKVIRIAPCAVLVLKPAQ
jgi:universal stress protein A